MAASICAMEDAKNEGCRSYAKWNLCCQRVSVADDWPTIISVPAVKLNTTTALKQHLVREIRTQMLSPNA